MLPLLLSVVVISASGVMMPGPMFAVTVAHSYWSPWAGPQVALGHAVIEVPLILIIYFGFARFFKNKIVQLVLSIIGGGTIIWLGISMFFARAEIISGSTDLLYNPFIAGIITTLFLSGWKGPFLPTWLWFLIKVFAVVFVFIWARGSWPRFRIDHMLNFAWKFLVPLALVNLMVVALIDKLVAGAGMWVRLAALLGSNLILIVITLVIVAWAARRSRSTALRAVAGTR